jgi:hypothetical protein
MTRALLLALPVALLGCAPRWYLKPLTIDTTPTYFVCAREEQYGAAPPQSRLFESDQACLADDEYQKAETARAALKRLAVAEYTTSGTLRDRFVCGDAYAGTEDSPRIKVGEYGVPFENIAFYDRFALEEHRLCEAAALRHRQEAVEAFITSHPDAAAFADSIRRRRFAPGMSEELVRTVFGSPQRVQRLDTASGAVVVWRYPEVLLTFQGGALVDWVAPR